ncbi:MAG: hypothetical protein RQ748_08785 [Elusimicrobiales bacterium]|nr:hypothetical protein [Elusimicrobiales bacterium]
MMHGVETIYDEAFFREWGPGNKDYVDMLELAEHIPEELSGVFLENLARGGGDKSAVLPFSVRLDGGGR